MQTLILPPPLRPICIVTDYPYIPLQVSNLQLETFSKHYFPGFWLVCKNVEIFLIFTSLCWDTDMRLILISNMEKTLMISLEVKFLH